MSDTRYTVASSVNLIKGEVCSWCDDLAPVKITERSTDGLYQWVDYGCQVHARYYYPGLFPSLCPNPVASSHTCGICLITFGSWADLNIHWDTVNCDPIPAPTCTGTRTVWGATWCDSCADQGVWHSL